jgi:hypothetical protein
MNIGDRVKVLRKPYTSSRGLSDRYGHVVRLLDDVCTRDHRAPDCPCSNKGHALAPHARVAFNDFEATIEVGSLKVCK